MKTLPKVIMSDDGFTLTRVMCEDDVAIYCQTKRIGRAVIEHYEVVIHGKPGYPASGDWGVHGWTCPTLDAAWARIARIRAEREEKARLGLGLGPGEVATPIERLDRLWEASALG